MYGANILNLKLPQYYYLNAFDALILPFENNEEGK
jgi:hypothetical protein